MPKYQAIAPDGQEYDIEGADMQSAVAALQKMRGTPVTDPHILAQLNGGILGNLILAQLAIAIPIESLQ